MKNILIMRHAKSDWDTADTDFDRPLNKRGEKAAPLMGKFLLNKGKVPNQIIASPAERAKTTAQFVKEALNDTREIVFNSNYYYGNEEAMMDDLFALNDQIESVLLIGHNPTVESLVNKLTGDYRTMVTATVVSINANIDKWSDLQLHENKLEWAMSPKTI